MSYKDIAKIIPTMQSLALLKENTKQLKKKKTKTKDIASLGVKNIFGTSMLKLNADLIGGL